ncbi:MAG: hypothetical protein JWO38_719 [Gemmataceae bacterium]|nr:hypothetical protein [Gemmataceae bacterium]
MSLSPLEPARLAVLALSGAAEGLRWVGLGSGGGFSGAVIWRGEDKSGKPVLALKAWPADGITADQLAEVHGWMTRAAHLPFVPAVLPARGGSTVVAEAGRVWDLTSWMPGFADFHTHPTPARLANACAALARIHRAWAPRPPASAPCPGVRRRLRALADWRALRPQLIDPAPLGHMELDDALRRGAAAVDRLAPAAERALLPWAGRRVAVRPCLCDVRHDHVLYTADAVTGVIDYGAVKEDHVAVDLARLLGDLIGDDDEAFSAGLDAYRAAGGPLDLPAEFVRLLDRTGVVCAVVGWLVRLVVEPRPYPDRQAVAGRVRQLAARLETGPGR